MQSIPHAFVRPAVATLALLLCATFAHATDEPADAITGLWLTEEGEGKIRVFRCGKKYCGKVVWIRPSKEWPDPTQMTDLKNPDPQKRSRKVVGSTMLWGLAFDAEDGVYEGGRIYDNTRGQVFTCKVWVEDGGKTLKLRGFVGVSLLGQNTYWSRLK